MGAEPLPKGEQVPDSIPANPVPIEMFAGTGELGRLPGIKPDSSFLLWTVLLAKPATF